MFASEKLKIKSAYGVLGLHPGASDEAIRAAYIRLVKEYHPDSGFGYDNADEKLKRINVAFTLLRNADTRKRYDEIVKRRSRGRLLPNYSKTAVIKRQVLFATALGGAAIAAILMYAQVNNAEFEVYVRPQAPQAHERRDTTAPGKQASLPRRMITVSVPPGSEAKQEEPIEVQELERPPSLVAGPRPLLIEQPPVTRAAITRKTVESIEPHVSALQDRPLPKSKTGESFKRTDRIAVARDPKGKAEHVGDILSGGF